MVFFWFILYLHKPYKRKISVEGMIEYETRVGKDVDISGEVGRAGYLNEAGNESIFKVGDLRELDLSYYLNKKQSKLTGKLEGIYSDGIQLRLHLMKGEIDEKTVRGPPKPKNEGDSIWTGDNSVTAILALDSHKRIYAHLNEVRNISHD